MSLNVFERSKYLSHESGVHLTLVHEVSMSMLTTNTMYIPQSRMKSNSALYNSLMMCMCQSILSEGGSLFHIYSNRTTNAQGMSTYDNASSISNIQCTLYIISNALSIDYSNQSVYSIEEPKGSYASHVGMLDSIRKYLIAQVSYIIVDNRIRCRDMV